MKLKAVVKSLDGLDEGVAALYKKEGDVFVLDIDGVDDHPTVQNLSKTMKTVRLEKKETEKELKALMDKVSGLDLENIEKLKDIDPASYEKVLGELETLKQEEDKRNKQKLKDEKQWEKLEQQLIKDHQDAVAKQTQAFESEKQSLLEKINKNTTESEEKMNSMLSSLKSHLKDKELTSELAKAKGNIPILMPHISPFVDVRSDKSGNYTAVVVDKEKNPRVDNHGKPMTIEQLVAEFREKPEFSGDGLFAKEKQSGGSGSGGNRGGDDFAQNNPFAKETLNYTKQSELFHKDPALFQKLKEAAGKD